MMLGTAAIRSTIVVSRPRSRRGANSVMYSAAVSAIGTATTSATRATSTVPVSRPRTPNVPLLGSHTSSVRNPQPARSSALLPWYSR